MLNGVGEADKRGGWVPKVELEIGEAYLEFLTAKAEKYGVQVPALVTAAVMQLHPLPADAKRKVQARQALLSNVEEGKRKEFITKWKACEAYKGLNIDAEISKCRQWCEANNAGTPTASRIVNWLNRASEKVTFAGGKPSMALPQMPKPEIMTMADPTPEERERNRVEATNLARKIFGGTIVETTKEES